MAAAQLKAFLTRITGSNAQLVTLDPNSCRPSAHEPTAVDVYSAGDILDVDETVATTTVTMAQSPSAGNETSLYADVSLVETAYHKERFRIRMFVSACVRAL